MSSRKVRYSWLVVCLAVLLVISWSAPAVAEEPIDRRFAAGPDGEAPGGVMAPARPGSQNIAPGKLTTVDPENCPTCLQNGTKTGISGNQLFLIGENGKATLAKDGSYKLQNGSTIIVTKGKVAGQVKPGSAVTGQPASRPVAAETIPRGNTVQQPGSDPGALNLKAPGVGKTTDQKVVTSPPGARKSGGLKGKPGSQVSGSEEEDLEDLEVQR